MKYKNSKYIIFLPIITSIAIVFGLILGMTIHNKEERVTMDKLQMMEKVIPSDSKLGTILKLIDKKYVDNVKMDSITEDIIPELLKKLDPHSVYIPVKDAVETNESLEGEFDGIGIVFNMATDTVIIQNVISGGPSNKVGIINGDRVIYVGDSIIAGVKKNQKEVVKLLKGKRGTEVNLKIERLGSDNLIPFTVVRDKIVIKSIDAAFMIEPEVGFIKLSQFSRSSYKEFIDAADRLKKEGMKKLIFDLTDNPGGFLDQAILISNEFLPKDKLIVYTEGRANNPIREYSDGKGRLTDLEVVVLMSESSASSSEIVAGALQDNDVGIIIGRRSFGKGLVQQQIPLKDGSFVNLTIARYHTPTGRCIQRPYDKGKDEYYNDIIGRFNSSEVLSRDSIKLIDSLKYTTPKGKVVYGGGGIMPDVFVPIDTTQLKGYTRRVLSGNNLFLYSLKFTDKNRNELNSLDNMDKVKEFFDKHGYTLFNGLVAHLKTKGVTGTPKEIENSRSILEPYLKAYIGRNTPMDDNAFYLYFNNIDDVVKKGIEACTTGVELDKNI